MTVIPDLRRCLLPQLAATALVITTPASLVQAEPVLDRLLSEVRVVSGRPDCAVVQVTFNARVQHVSHFPQQAGPELRIRLRLFDAANAVAARREAARLPASLLPILKSIEIDNAGNDAPALIVLFQRPATFKIAQGGDFESIFLAFPKNPSNRDCTPKPSPGNEWLASTRVVPQKQPAKTTAASSHGVAAPSLRSGPASPDDEKNAETAVKDARAALKRSDYEAAIKLLRRALALPRNTFTQDAYELLGVSLQKAKRSAEAKAVFEEYLALYPTGEGADSVRQRLAVIVTATADRETQLRELKSPKDQAAAPTWIVSGSASQFYVRDDSFRVLRDPSLPPDLNPDREDHRVHRNALLSSLDLLAVWNSGDVKSKLRFSGTEEHQFNSGNEIVGVSALFLETAVKSWDTTFRVGRQSRNSGGVLGRFDGALVSWQSTPWLRVNVVGGSPVASRKDEPFKDEKYFYGASADFGHLWQGLDLSAFVIEQRAGDIIDRQAIGLEARYVQPGKSFFATIDYDTHFATLNAAIANGSWTFYDKSTLTAGVDYRKAPYLTSWNALQGQSFLTLHDLLQARTQAEVWQMALDRTATYQAVSAGYSIPLTSKVQASFDVTAAHTDGTIPSFGIDATPSTGNEMYYSARLNIADALWAGDMLMLGGRVADRKDSTTYVADVGLRLPLTSQWRINPRILASYREGKGIDLVEYSVMPTILLNYFWTRDLSFELEVGNKWTWREQDNVRERATDFFFTAGIRYDFQVEGSLCPSGIASCK